MNMERRKSEAIRRGPAGVLAYGTEQELHKRLHHRLVACLQEMPYFTS